MEPISLNLSFLVALVFGAPSNISPEPTPVAPVAQVAAEDDGFDFGDVFAAFDDDD